MLKQNKASENAQKFSHHNMVLTIFGLVIIFVIVQFLKLATVGRLGSEITSVENEISAFELENEILRSKISKLKSSTQLENVLSDNQNLVQVDVEVIESEGSATVAQQ